MSRLGWAAVVTSTLGVGLIVGCPSGGGDWLGDGLVALSVVSIVAAILLSKHLLKRYAALTATTYIIVFGTLALVPIALAWQGIPVLHLSTSGWLSLALLGVGATAATNVLWNWGLQHTAASHAGVYANLEPLVGALPGLPMLHDPLGASAAVGGLIVLLAALAVSLWRTWCPCAAAFDRPPDLADDGRCRVHAERLAPLPAANGRRRPAPPWRQR